MRILLLCDDLWHPGEVVTRGLRPFRKLGYDPDTVMAPKDVLTPEMIREYDVIINARGAAHSPANFQAPWFEPGVTEVMPEDFRAYVEEGGGFIALHAGNTFSEKNVPAMAELVGNAFIGHPPRCRVEARPVGDHPIVKGVGPFTIRDEHYRIRLLADDAEVFLETTSDTPAGTQVAGYTRKIGKGRLCVLTPGHNCSVLESEPFTRLLANAVEWCAGNPV